MIEYKFKIRNKEITVNTDRKALIKMGIILFLYLLFLIWVKSWWGVLVIPFIVDNYTTHIVQWKWWKKWKNETHRKIMSWVDAIIFALVAVYFVHLYLFQNYVIPTSSLEKTLLVGDYLFVSKVNYGPRKPQTPLSMPLTQHTMPIFGCKSYIDALQWDYERAAGFEDIERGDIVVFNYPAGDIATTNPTVTDFHAWCYRIGMDLKLEQLKISNKPLPETFSHADYEQIYRMGYDYMKSNPGKFGEIVHRPVDRRENYVKRCIALPGDLLEIKNKEVYVNGKVTPLPKNAQFDYKVVLASELTEEQRREFGISVEDAKALTVCRPWKIDDAIREEYGLTTDFVETLRSNNTPVVMGTLPLTTENYNRFKANKRWCKSIKVADSNIANGIYDGNPCYTTYPLNGNTGWSNDNYGPIWIPKKGANIDLTTENIAIYERPIVAYEGNKLEVKDGKIFINGKETNKYTFKMDYYWMMGDNRHNSADSRSWGFVPEDHIVGKALFVWLSLDKDRGWFDGKIRWSRMFRGVGSFD